MPSSATEPLLDFDPPSATIAARLAALDSRAAEYRNRLSSGTLLENAHEAVRIENTYHSNAIEGNTLSLRDTQLVIEGRSPAASHSLREIYEARNHDRALRMVERWVADRGATRPIAEADIRAIHEAVLADIDPRAGSFRTERVLIAGTGFVPPGSHKFDSLIPEMLTLTNRVGVHAVVSAAELHYNLAAIHPFRDGNGRTARLMMNYRLLRGGFPITAIDVARRSSYLEAFDAANGGRFEPFLEFVAGSVERAFERVMGNSDV